MEIFGSTLDLPRHHPKRRGTFCHLKSSLKLPLCICATIVKDHFTKRAFLCLIRKLAIFAVSNKLVQYMYIPFSTQEQAQHVVLLQKKKI